MYDFCTIKSVEGRLCVIEAGLDHLNHGSVIEVMFFREEDIVQQPDYSFTFDEHMRAELDGQLVLRTGAVGYRFRFTPDTGSFTEPSNETDDGIYYDQLLTINIPKDRPEITWLKYRMRYGRYAVLYRDANGLVKFLRDRRVKFDLNTGRNRGEYNGHVLSARRLNTTPALFWKLAAGDSLETLFTEAMLVMRYNNFTLPEGWQVGKQLTLSHTPASNDSLVVTYNDALYVLDGEHYTLNGRDLTLQFLDVIDDGGDGNLYIRYAADEIGTAIGGFVQHEHPFTSAAASGTTITLPSTPQDIDSLLLTWNQTLTLRPGVHYTLAGNVVTLLFDIDPDGDTDIITAQYTIDGTLTIAGWNQYRHDEPLESLGGITFNLPHVPLAHSLLVYLDNTLLLRPGTDYNILGDEIQILFDVVADSRFDCWYAY